MNSLIRAQVWSRLGRRRHVHQAGWTTVSHHVRFNTANHHPPPPQSTRPQRQRYVRPLVYASTFLLLGLTIAQPFRQALDARLLIPDSPEDVLLLNRISAEADQLPIVKTLRSPGTTATWQEWDAYASMPVSERLGRLTSGPMRGARGLALQRVFWNQQDQKAVSIIWLGSDLCGWPGVVHGGAIATVMDESLGRAAIRRFPAKTGILSPPPFFPFPLPISLKKK